MTCGSRWNKVCYPYFVEGARKESEKSLRKVTVRAGWAGWTKVCPAQVCLCRGGDASLGVGCEASVERSVVVLTRLSFLGVGQEKEFFREKNTE